MAEVMAEIGAERVFREGILWSVRGGEGFEYLMKLRGLDLQRLGWVLMALALAFLGPVSVAQAAWYWPFGDKGLDYRVEFGGIDDETLAWFKKLQLDEKNKDQPVTTDDQLEQELAARGGRVRQALAAIGYYDASVQQMLRHEEKKKPVLVYSIQPGPHYIVGKLVLEWDGEVLKQIDTATLHSKVGQPVNAALIIQDGVDILNAVGDKACLLALDVSPLVKLYANRRRADVVFRVHHGAVANFGPTTVSGTERLDDKVVLRSVTWKQGHCFKQSKVDETRTNLVESQLFSTVSISHTDIPDAQGQVPMVVAVQERAARTLRAGASYSTDEGAVVNGGWEHRNLWGGGEKLDADVSIGQQEQDLTTTLRLPSFLNNDKQTLVLNGGITHEDRDAYTADTVQTGASLERKLNRHLRGGVGVGFMLKETDDVLAGTSNYALLSFPGFLEYDTRDNLLDPHKGVLGNVTVTPYTDTFGDGGQFLKTQLSGQTYLSAALPLSPTLALKVAGGSISGASGNNVPSDIRFYAGGGGSVRGYGYQTLGPRLDTTPIGGSSFVTASAEARLRFTQDVGGVVFMDAGNAFADSMPGKDAKLYTSAGIGLRYFTGIGPIRADIAVPMNGQDIGAPAYAIYVSIGQSF